MNETPYPLGIEEEIEYEHESSRAMPPGIVQLLIKLSEDYKSPVSFALIMALLGTVGYLVASHVSPSQLAEVQQADERHINALEVKIGSVQVSVGRLDFTSEYNHADTGLSRAQEQIFTLEQHMKRKGYSDDDGSDAHRMKELKDLQEKYKGQMARLDTRRDNDPNLPRD